MNQYYQKDHRMEREKKIIDQELASVTTLDEESKRELRDCYLQRNTIASTAYKLDMNPMEVQMWYYRLSMSQVRSAFQNT